MIAKETMLTGLSKQQIEIKKLKRLVTILEAENQKLKLELKKR